MVYLNVVSKLY